MTDLALTQMNAGQRRPTFPDYPFAANFVQTPGGSMHYIDEGSGPAVIMLHGNPTWSYYYRHLITALSSRFRVIAPDHIGCGLSDKPEGYDYCLNNHINNISYLLDHLHINSCSLVVHDWGGAIGMGYATRNSASIQRLVILNTAAFPSRRIPLRIRICRWPLLGALIVRGCNGFAWPATFMAVQKPLAKEVAAAYLAPYGSWRQRVGIHRFVKDIPLSPAHPSFRTLVEIGDGLNRLAERQTPTLLVWGGKDFCFNDHFYRQWTTRFPHARCHYLAAAGHYVLEDGHGMVEPLIASFLHD
ncbi:haloalkane dehalogenase [Desulfofustis glycolicus DSM 9705]|uniref:Haloalkane dehalogenase n=2 Tax=Desulfofustis glycolicus TaxID=51195 RepID=A0A1M5U5U4_9BACT|nr:haloalkane dehalogenase [Desulfofustis glycolicus DSM 9705]